MANQSSKLQISLLLSLLIVPLMTILGALTFAVYAFFSGMGLEQIEKTSAFAVILLLSMLLSYGILTFLAARYARSAYKDMVRLLIVQRETVKTHSFFCFFALLLGAGLAYGLVFVQQLFPPNTAFDTSIQQAISNTPTSFYIIFLVTVVLAPICEEALFRGLLQTQLQQYFLENPLKNNGSNGTWLATFSAISLSSLVFMAVHLLEYYQYWLAYVSVFFVGIVLAVLRHVSRSLWPSIMAHGSYNWVILSQL